MSTSAKTKAFHQQSSHHSAHQQAATPSTTTSSTGDLPSGFTQNINSSSLLLIDTSSPPLSVSDNGSVSSCNESSTNNSHHNHGQPQHQQASNSSSSANTSNMLWVNENGSNENSNVNTNSENSNGQSFQRQSNRGSSGYLRTTSDSNGNSSVYSEIPSPVPSQRSTNSLTIATSSQNDYLRYQGNNSSGTILWPLPPVNTNQQQHIASSPHCDTQSPSLASSSHQQSSATTQNALFKTAHSMHGNGGGDHHGGQPIVNSKSNKKESHNRIERKRRDYINTQIASLGTLLPQELYRGVDGKRNKGSVLKLSVNYIQELRSQLARINTIQEENQLARQLIPVILQRVKFLEKTMTKLLNECFKNNDQSDNGLSSEKSQASITDQIEKKFLKFQKLLYEAISNRFDPTTNTTPQSLTSATSALKWDPETFDGIESENQSILENDVVQAWLRVFENNKTSEAYPGQGLDQESKGEYMPNGSDDREDNFFQNCLQDIQMTNKRMTENSILTGTKHRFMNDSTGPSSAAKNCRRSTRNSNNMSNCSSEASNTDESSPISNMASTTCPVEHRLFYASNQGNSSNNDSSNSNCLDGNQSLLLPYSTSNHNQSGNTTDFSLSHIQTSDILLSNSHGNACSMNNNSSSSNNNHCIGMRNDKVSEEMLCQNDSSVIDNPIILSTFFGPNAYEDNISNNQSLLSSDQLHHLNNNHYQMLLHQHQNTSDHQGGDGGGNSRNGSSTDNIYHHITHQHHQIPTHLQSNRSNQPA